MDIVGLIPSFGGLLYTVAAFVVALSIIVAVHEFGHYIVGRWSGIHAEVFSIGFGPVLFSREDHWGTKWQIAALPFGGYVKFLGDAGVASDKASPMMAQMDEETRRHTLHGAPLWARAATVLAGPVFNFILSILVFFAIGLFRGEAIEPPTVGDLNTVPAGTAQLMPGDRILAIDGIEIPDYTALYEATDTLPFDPALPYTVLRDGQELAVEGPYPFPPLIDGLQPGAGMEAGLKKGDVIISVDGTPVTAFKELQNVVLASDGAALQLGVWRNGEEFEVSLTPRSVDMPMPDGSFETRLLIGISGGLVFDPATQTPGPLQALSDGVAQTWFIIRSSISGLYHMITGAISSCNLQGPIGIAEVSGAAASQGWGTFISFIAMLSTAVGLLNLFPIPVLDGGHLLFHVYEAVRGKPPSDRALSVLMSLGLALMGTLMIFALGNDLLFCP